jgi:putative superfamily III holin-X
MTQTTSTARPVTVRELSTAELVHQMSEQVSVLVRDELKLARVEMTRKGKQAGLGAGMFGGSGLLAVYGVGCLLACAIIAISQLVQPWLAAMIIGVALMAAAAVAALLGMARLRKATPSAPEQAAGSVKADIQEIRERAHR